jgi:formylmethanofuran dehydrogenase subunit A
MLLRTHASNGGKFPTHLLTKLGSQVYDIPPDQVDLSNNNSRRITTTTTTRYYTVNQGEQGYESAVDETSPQYSGEEKYVQIKASDLKDVLASYDAYPNSGEKLEGDDSNY